MERQSNALSSILDSASLHPGDSVRWARLVSQFRVEEGFGRYDDFDFDFDNDKDKDKDKDPKSDIGNSAFAVRPIGYLAREQCAHGVDMVSVPCALVVPVAFDAGKAQCEPA